MSVFRWVFLVELPGKGHGFLLPTHHIPQVGGQREGKKLDNCVAGVSVQHGRAQGIPDCTGRQALNVKDNIWWAALILVLTD